jgi:hypothetical protein
MVAVIGEVEARRVLGSNHLVDGGLVRVGGSSIRKPVSTEAIDQS